MFVSKIGRNKILVRRTVVASSGDGRTVKRTYSITQPQKDRKTKLLFAFVTVRGNESGTKINVRLNGEDVIDILKDALMYISSDLYLLNEHYGYDFEWRGQANGGFPYFPDFRLLQTSSLDMDKVKPGEVLNRELSALLAEVSAADMQIFSTSGNAVPTAPSLSPGTVINYSGQGRIFGCTTFVIMSGSRFNQFGWVLAIPMLLGGRGYRRHGFAVPAELDHGIRGIAICHRLFTMELRASEFTVLGILGTSTFEEIGRRAKSIIAA
ncbi:hypothetical protein [Bryobacter aggregatus]|uniref:hypothetical protein n=1 Tax=Bryobacter aggregatus TaxID=360054 RepID=UPI0004E232DA|nr:hypothetical protein [Bryobacter aggregatus]